MKSVGETKSPAHAASTSASCCGDHRRPEGGTAHAHGKCASHEGDAEPAATAGSAGDQGGSASSARAHPKRSSCCGRG